MSALKAGDYDKLDEAVQRERAAIEAQADLLKAAAAATDVATAATTRRPKRKKKSPV
jgi:hypothetical protein